MARTKNVPVKSKKKKTPESSMDENRNKKTKKQQQQQEESKGSGDEVKETKTRKNHRIKNNTMVLKAKNQKYEPALRNVFTFYRLRRQILVPFLLRDMLKNRRQEFLQEIRSKSQAKNKQETENRKPTKNRKAVVESSEDEVSHNEEWSGWDNHD